MKQFSAVFSVLILLVAAGCSAASTAVNALPAAPSLSPSPSLVPSQAGPSATPAFVQIFQSSGFEKGTTGFFTIQAGTAKVTWKYTGPGEFTVYLMQTNSGNEQLVVDTSGNADGQGLLKIEKAGNYVFEVKDGKGNWALSLAYRP